MSVNFVDFFRSTAPYIHDHRDKTLVILITGETWDGDYWSSLLHDLALLNSLGQKVVAVYGARPQINRALNDQGLSSGFHQHYRITDHRALNIIAEVHGRLKGQIESQLSLGMVNSPMQHARVRCVSGNFVTAKPLGVIDGTNMHFTGKVRRVDHEAISQQLEQGNVVLINHLGYSPTGEIFNLSAEQVAVEVAAAINSDKLVIVGNNALALENQSPFKAFVPSECEKILQQHQPTDPGYPELEAAMAACKKGVSRCHLVSCQDDGSLLMELYTRNGKGALITKQPYDSLRQARIDDVVGILDLLEPLEQKGVLVKRSRELLESEINHFMVNELDGKIIGCAALYPFEEGDCHMAELACVAIDKNYRQQARGEHLLFVVENEARSIGVEKLFVLTTSTAHWFIERGFKAASTEDLPKQKQSLYNYQRNSQVFIKELDLI